MQNTGKQRSVAGWVRKITLIFIPIMLIGVILGLYSFFNLRRQQAENLQNILYFHTRTLNDTLKSINYYLLDALLRNPDVAALTDESDPVHTVAHANSVIEEFIAAQNMVGNEFNFFLYHPAQDTYYAAPAKKVSYKEMQGFRNAISESLLAGDGAYGQSSGQWQLFLLDGTYYLTNIYLYKGQYIGCWARVDHLLSFIDNAIASGDNNFYVLFDSNNTPLTHGEEWIKLDAGPIRDASFHAGIYKTYLVVPGTMSQASFSYAVVVNNQEASRGIMFVILLLLLATGLLIFVSIFLLHRLEREIVDSVRYFSRHLSEYSQHRIVPPNKRFRELAQAEDIFDDLHQQVQKLKIDIYEEKIQHQRMELEHLQMQIKPHFYLNCLNVIYSMAETRHYKEIQCLSRLLSEYLHYSFRIGSRFVPLRDELHYAETYLQIQAARYRSALEYEIDGEEASGCMVPPFMVISLVENAVKYSVTLDTRAKIGIRCTRKTISDKGKVEIVVTDSGKGFPPEILRDLNAGKTLPDDNGRRRVGLANTRQRLSFLYGEDAEMYCYNLPEGGAAVRLRLPAHDEMR